MWAMYRRSTNRKRQRQFMNSSQTSNHLPTIRDVEAAARRIAGQAIETPLLEWPALNERVGGRVLVKPELLQRTGSFKFRGAFNKLKHLIEAGDGKGGVVAYSSGNPAPGVAAAAPILGGSAALFMPAGAPPLHPAHNPTPRSPNA